jgi:two-component system chemotaxis response regulator CheY
MCKLLIVDDSKLSRMILRSYLEPAGYQVVEAKDGSAALEKYPAERPDLVLLDLTMLGLSGIQVLAKLREMDRLARVVIAAADLKNSTRALIRSVGIANYIVKPFGRDQVLDAVRVALQAPRAE